MIIAHKFLSWIANELWCTLRTAKKMVKQWIIQKVDLKNTKARPESKATKQSIAKWRNIIRVYAPSFLTVFAQAISRPWREETKSV